MVFANLKRINMFAIVVQLLCVCCVLRQIECAYLDQVDNRIDESSDRVKNFRESVQDPSTDETTKNLKTLRKCIYEETNKQMQQILEKVVEKSTEDQNSKAIKNPFLQNIQIRRSAPQIRTTRQDANEKWNKCVLKSELEEHKFLENAHIASIKQELQKLQELVRLLRDQQYILNILNDYDTKARPKDIQDEKEIAEILSYMKNISSRKEKNLKPEAKTEDASNEIPIEQVKIVKNIIKESPENLTKLAQEIQQLKHLIVNKSLQEVQNEKNEENLKHELENQRKSLADLQNTIEIVRSASSRNETGSSAKMREAEPENQVEQIQDKLQDLQNKISDLMSIIKPSENSNIVGMGVPKPIFKSPQVQARKTISEEDDLENLLSLLSDNKPKPKTQLQNTKSEIEDLEKELNNLSQPFNNRKSPVPPTNQPNPKARADGDEFLEGLQRLLINSDQTIEQKENPSSNLENKVSTLQKQLELSRKIQKVEKKMKELHENEEIQSKTLGDEDEALQKRLKKIESQIKKMGRTQVQSKDLEDEDELENELKSLQKEINKLKPKSDDELSEGKIGTSEFQIMLNKLITQQGSVGPAFSLPPSQTDHLHLTPAQIQILKTKVMGMNHGQLEGGQKYFGRQYGSGPSLYGSPYGTGFGKSQYGSSQYVPYGPQYGTGGGQYNSIQGGSQYSGSSGGSYGSGIGASSYGSGGVSYGSPYGPGNSNHGGPQYGNSAGSYGSGSTSYGTDQYGQNQNIYGGTGSYSSNKYGSSGTYFDSTPAQYGASGNPNDFSNMLYNILDAPYGSSKQYGGGNNQYGNAQYSSGQKQYGSSQGQYDSGQGQYGSGQGQYGSGQGKYRYGPNAPYNSYGSGSPNYGSENGPYGSNTGLYGNGFGPSTAPYKSAIGGGQFNSYQSPNPAYGGGYGSGNKQTGVVPYGSANAADAGYNTYSSGGNGIQYAPFKPYGAAYAGPAEQNLNQGGKYDAQQEYSKGPKPYGLPSSQPSAPYNAELPTYSQTDAYSGGKIDTKVYKPQSGNANFNVHSIFEHLSGGYQGEPKNQFFQGYQMSRYQKPETENYLSSNTADGSSSAQPYANPPQNSGSGNSAYAQEKVGDLKSQIYSLQHVIGDLNRPEYVQKPDDQDTVYKLDKKINDLKVVVNHLTQDSPYGGANSYSAGPGYQQNSGMDGSYSPKSNLAQQGINEQQQYRENRRRKREVDEKSKSAESIRYLLQQFTNVIDVVGYVLQGTPNDTSVEESNNQIQSKSPNRRKREDSKNEESSNVMDQLLNQLSDIMSVISFFSESMPGLTNQTTIISNSSTIDGPYNSSSIQVNRQTRRAEENNENLLDLFGQLNKLIDIVNNLAKDVFEDDCSCQRYKNSGRSSKSKKVHSEIIRKKRQNEEDEEEDDDEETKEVLDKVSGFFKGLIDEKPKSDGMEVPRENQAVLTRPSNEDFHNDQQKLQDKLQELKKQLEMKLHQNMANQQSSSSNQRSSILDQSRESYGQPNYYQQPGYYSYYPQVQYYQEPSYESKEKTKKFKLKKKTKKNDVLDKIFNKILDKILDKIEDATPKVIHRLLGLGVDQIFEYGKGDYGYEQNDYGQDGYDGKGYEVKTSYKKFGLLSYIPMLIIKLLTNFSYFVKVLQKNKFIKIFLVPALITAGTAGMVVFLVWWLSGDDLYGYSSSGGGNNYGYSGGYEGGNGYRSSADSRSDYLYYDNNLYKNNYLTNGVPNDKNYYDEKQNYYNRRNRELEHNFNNKNYYNKNVDRNNNYYRSDNTDNHYHPNNINNNLYNPYNNRYL